jgi:hypothetical protein
MFSKQSYSGQGMVQPMAVSQSGQNLARGIEKFGEGIGQAFRSAGESRKLRSQLLTFADEFKPDNFQGTDKDWSKMFESQLEDKGLSDLRGMMEGGLIRKTLQMYNAKLESARLQNQGTQRGIDQGIANDEFLMRLGRGETPRQAISQFAPGDVVPSSAAQYITQEVAGTKDREQAKILSNAAGIDVPSRATSATTQQVIDNQLAQSKMDAAKDSAAIDERYKNALIGQLEAKRQQAEAEVGQLSNEQKTRIDSVYNSYIKAAPIDDYIKSEAQFKQLQDVILQKGSTGAQGLATVFAFMKSLDPDSVVREGEQQQAQKTGGLFDSIVSTLNDAVGKGKLTPQVRKNILDVSRTALQARLKDANAYRQSTIERQQSIEPGIDPTLYVSSEFNPTMYQVFDSWEEAQQAQAQGKIQAGEKIYFMEGSGFRSATGN